MTRNLYLGAEITAALKDTPREQIPAAVASVWASVAATRFPERAIAIAEEIDVTRPDLIGLQEATLYRTQSPGDALLGNPVAATDVVLDFLQTLLQELATRGLSYTAVAIAENADVELPLATPAGGLDDLRLTDRDVILVREGIPVDDARHGFYATNLSVRVGDVFTLVVLRGWTAVDVIIDGERFHFWNTHLETAEEGPAIQPIQAAELIQLLQDDGLPRVVVGDFNSAADGSTTPTYSSLLAGGLDDAWIQARGPDPGNTCCHAADLLNPVPSLTRRIDLILLHGNSVGLSAMRLGADPAERTPSGLWPSDHAGVVATVRLAFR